MKNLYDILKNVKTNITLYSPVTGDVIFIETDERQNQIIVKSKSQPSVFLKFDQYGRMYTFGERLLFPDSSKSWVDWQDILFTKGVVIHEENGSCSMLYVGNSKAYDKYGIINEINIKLYRFSTVDETLYFWKELRSNGFEWDGRNEKIVPIEQKEFCDFKEGFWYQCLEDVREDEYVLFEQGKCYLSKCDGYINNEYGDSLHGKSNKFRVASEADINRCLKNALFKVGDWIVINTEAEERPDMVEPGAPVHVDFVDIVNQRYTLSGYQKTTESFEAVERDYHAWKISDAKAGDILETEDGRAFIYNGNMDNGYPCAFCGVDTQYSLFVCGEDNKSLWTRSKCYPASHNARMRLFELIVSAGYIWESEELCLKKIHLQENQKDKKFKFKPFDKVIGKFIGHTWVCDFFSHYDEDRKTYVCVSGTYTECVPYNVYTEHLIGTEEKYNE